MTPNTCDNRAPTGHTYTGTEVAGVYALVQGAAAPERQGEPEICMIFDDS